MSTPTQTIFNIYSAILCVLYMINNSKKRLVLIISALIVVAISTFIIINREGMEQEYTSSSNISATPAGTAPAPTEPELLAQEVIGVLIEESPELSLLDVLNTINNSLTERFLIYYENTIGLQTENVSDEQKQQVLKSFLEQENVSAMLRNYKTYTLQDLTIRNVTTESVSEYVEGFEKNILVNADIQGLENELVIYKKAQYGTETEKKLAETNLLVIESTYQNILSSLLSLRVPVNIAENHLELLNQISISISRVNGMAFINRDPLRARIYAEAYEQQIPEFTKAYDNVIVYINQNK